MTNAPGPPAPPPVTDVAINDELKEMINGALDAGTPFIMAYVDPDGQPSLSFRGSTHVHSANQLAVWVRNADGGLLNAIEKNNRLTFFMRNPQTRASVQIRGRAHLENTPEMREKVYKESPEREQQADPEQKGMPLIVDIDRAEGMTSGGRFRMQKS